MGEYVRCCRRIGLGDQHRRQPGAAVVQHRTVRGGFLWRSHPLWLLGVHSVEGRSGVAGYVPIQQVMLR